MSTQSSVAWTSIHLIALLHRDIGLSSAQCFELAEALNVTPNELDRKMGDVVRAFEELTGELNPGAPRTPRKDPSKPRKLRKIEQALKQKEVSLPFLKSPFGAETVLENRAYNPRNVDPQNRAFYTARDRIEALEDTALQALRGLEEGVFVRSLYVLKILRFALYDVRMARMFASRKTALLKQLNDPKVTSIQGVALPPYVPGASPPKNPTPCPLWFALPPSIREQILSRDDGKEPNAFKEYLRFRAAYGYGFRKSLSLAGVNARQVRELYKELGWR